MQRNVSEPKTEPQGQRRTLWQALARLETYLKGL